MLDESRGEPYDLLLSSKRIASADGERPGTVCVRDGRIVDITDYRPNAGDDLGSVAILPGVVDAHVHFNEPGRTEWEGFASGTAAAAAGGVTLAVDMPLNSSPVVTTIAALAEKRQAAEGQLSCDVGFYGGLVPGNEAQVEHLADAGVLGIKAFLCDSGVDEFPAVTERELSIAMPVLAERGVPLLAHSEIVSPQQPMSNPRCYDDYLASRPGEFEQAAISLLIRLCRETGCRTHIVHLSDAECLPMLKAARDEGLPITVETCPHYLFFTSEVIPDGACQFKCAPPIRDRANCEQLWRALAEGTIDFITSDHSPCPPAMKKLEEGRFDQAWGGISSVQLTLPVVWTEAARRGFRLSDVVSWLCAHSARFVGQSSGLVIGAEASFVLFDPDTSFEVVAHQLHHRHPITPYNGCELRGVVEQTYLRGQPTTPGRGIVR